MKNYKVTALSTAVMLAIGLPAATPVLAAEEGFTLEEVMVTARKREESAMDVPISVTALDGKELEYRNITTTDQLTAVTPNLQFGTHSPSSGHNSAAPIFIRGVGQPDFIPSSDPGVGLYVDGVYVARSVGAATELLDLERIEILRGPQGTLFGRNTIGGAVVLHTKRPDEEFGGDIVLQLGDDNRIEIGGNVSVPLSDDVRLKFSARKRQRDGYVDNLFTGEDLGDDNTAAFRAALDWDVSDNTNAYLTVDYATEDENGAPTVFSTLNTSGLFARLAAGTAGPPPTVPNFGDRGVPDSNGVNQLCAFQNSQGADINNTGFTTDLVLNCGSAGSFDLGNSGPYTNFANGDLESKLDVLSTALTITTDFDGVEFKSITAFRNTEYDVKRDADSMPLTILHSENHDEIKQFSQEFQLSGIAMEDKLSWVAGLYYFKEDTDFDNPVFLPALTVGALNNAGELETENTAVFGQLTYDLSERLHLTAGIRYTDEEKLATPNFFAIGNYNVPNPFSTVGLRCGGPGLVVVTDPTDAINRPDAQCIGLSDGDLLYVRQENKLDFSQTTPMLSLSYDVGENGLVYATYSEGFKSGGYSTRIIQPVPSANNPDGVSLLPSFEPEEAKTLEVGFKQQLDNLRISGALFSTDYTNQHVVVRQGVAPITFNAGESTIQGFELEFAWTPTANWFVTGGLGYVKGEYDSFTGRLADNLAAAQAAFDAGTGPAPSEVGGLVDLDDELAYTPELSANLGVSYLMETDAGSFTPRLDWSHQGEIFFDAPNTDVISQSSINLLNFALLWESPDNHWELNLTVKNLTDETYRVGGNVSFSGSAYGESIFARGREWGLSVRRNF